MKAAARNEEHGRSIVLGKETSQGLTERISDREEGEDHPMQRDRTEDLKGAGTNRGKHHWIVSDASRH